MLAAVRACASTATAARRGPAEVSLMFPSGLCSRSDVIRS